MPDEPLPNAAWPFPQGGVGRPVAEKSLLTSIGGRVRQTRTEIQTVKLKGHTSSEQVHTNFLLHTPHDRTNQLAGGLHRDDFRLYLVYFTAATTRSRG